MRHPFTIAILGLAAGLTCGWLEGRGFGGRSGGSYSESRSASGGSDGRYGGASESYNKSYEGSHGGSVDASGTRGAAYGPNGATAGGTRDVSATGANGKTYNSQQERGAAAGPNGAGAYDSRSTTATDVNGQSYSGQAAAGATAYGGRGLRQPQRKRLGLPRRILFNPALRSRGSRSGPVWRVPGRRRGGPSPSLSCPALSCPALSAAGLPGPRWASRARCLCRANSGGACRPRPCGLPAGAAERILIVSSRRPRPQEQMI